MDDPRPALLADRERTLRRLAGLRADYAEVVDASRDTNADDEHDPEGQTIAFERSQTGSLVQQALRHLAGTDAALARADDGTYGTCTTCGEQVDPARLEARPAAATCLRCAAGPPRR